MAPLHGKNTTVLLGAVNLSSYLDSMDLSVDAERTDTSTFGTSWRTSLASFVEAKVDYSGYYDPTEATLPTLFNSALPAALTYCPGGGAAIGDSARLASALETTYAESSPVGGAVAIKGSFAADGAVGYGVVLHPLGEDTNTTVGAERDDTSATATGWIAHLHVLSVDGGTWTIKLEDAAVTNTYSDVTGGTFTGVTGAASQRLQSATSTTALRRYVRYTATRSGGVVGNGITFFLAYSRNG